MTLRINGLLVTQFLPNASKQINCSSERLSFNENDSEIINFLKAISDQVKDKKGNVVEEGDTVFTKIKGGKWEGEVSIHLPRVLYTS